MQNSLTSLQNNDQYRDSNIDALLVSENARNLTTNTLRSTKRANEDDLRNASH